MKTILILASNPREDLRIDREIRDLTSAIEISKNSDEYSVVIRLAVRPGDLHDIFDRYPPHIVHFSGHGEAEAGLVLESDDSGEQIITNKALSGLFNLFAKDSECVLLNACTTEIQADVIKQYVPYVIGTSREILDRAAYLFSVGFYTALGNGESIEVCFARGCNAIELELNNLDLETDIEEASRKGIVVLGTESSQEKNPLKIILKRNSRLINQDLFKNIPPASPEFAAKIRQEVVRKKYKNKLRDVLDNFGQTIIKRDKPISKFEYQQRQIFLDKVQEFWIDGFLKTSFYFNTAIDDLEVIPFDIDASYNILQRTGIIINEIGDGKTLLILGEPGSGKTIALLQLAERLIKKTRNHMEKPIPVVFNLSSWGEKRQPLKDWLIEELKDKYQVPKAWSKPWIRDRQLTLLLDGLDEVKAEYRDDCIIAINQFLADHIGTEIVVCSRIKDYDALKERIALSSVICIQPLSRQQVLDLLKNVDDSLIGLKNVIEKDREISDFARTPLILNMMTWTYHGWSEKECE
ncbi:MAG: NACHT domain-containing protein [Cyanobacteria bacterium P01_G01_bin.39]